MNDLKWKLCQLWMNLKFVFYIKIAKHFEKYRKNFYIKLFIIIIIIIYYFIIIIIIIYIY